jgi:hypothetical protein
MVDYFLFRLGAVNFLIWYLLIPLIIKLWDIIIYICIQHHLLEVQQHLGVHGDFGEHYLKSTFMVIGMELWYRSVSESLIFYDR